LPAAAAELAELVELLLQEAVEPVVLAHQVISREAHFVMPAAVAAPTTQLQVPVGWAEAVAAAELELPVQLILVAVAAAVLAATVVAAVQVL
jgi:hypothetical protein